MTSNKEKLHSIVKAYDVRGVAYEELTADIAHALGAAFADLLDAGDIVVSHDMRVSSPELASAFADGAVRRGSTVAFAGLSSTDQLYCASGLFNAAGAQFTASHNPAPDNGIKMCFAGARPVGRDSGLLEIRDAAVAYLDAGDIPVRDGGRIENVDTLDDYVEKVLELVPFSSTRPLKVVVDAANAMGGHTVPAVAQKLDFLDVVPLYFELDGSFPNHEANPLDYSNLVDLQKKVLETGADLGLAFDGDADRCIVVDENGDVVSPSAVTALIARNEIARAQADAEPAPVVIANAVSSRAVKQVIEENGGTYRRTRVGHSIIKAIMAEENAVFGGEHSAHYYFRDFYFADSGMLAALHVLRTLAASDKPLSEVVAEYNPYFSSGEINSRVDSVDDSIKEVLDHVSQFNPEVDDLDGVSVVHWSPEMQPEDRWWFSLRPSNTEPLLRLNVEAEKPETMEKMRDDLLAIIRGERASEAKQTHESSSVPAWVQAAVCCPAACHSELRMSEASWDCVKCGNSYEVVDSIPMLIEPK